MSRERTCGACDGTGRDLCEMCLAERYERYRFCRERCAACLGSGRIRESIPAADALADAETLRPMIDGREEFQMFLQRGKAATSIRAALSINKYRGMYWTGIAGRDAARAAFRAVPGLRGE